MKKKLSNEWICLTRKKKNFSNGCKKERPASHNPRIGKNLNIEQGTRNFELRSSDPSIVRNSLFLVRYLVSVRSDVVQKIKKSFDVASVVVRYVFDCCST